MPGRDGTGPMGQGAFTGRGMGTGNDTGVTGYGRGYGRGDGRGFGAGPGRGIVRGARFGLGLGLGYGCRRLLNRQITAVEDQETLAQEKAFLQRRLDAITGLLNSESDPNR